MTKADFLHCRIDSEIKKKLRQKADVEKLDLTGFLEKVANEDVVFIDENVKKLFGVLKLQIRAC